MEFWAGEFLALRRLFIGIFSCFVFVCIVACVPDNVFTTSEASLFAFVPVPSAVSCPVDVFQSKHVILEAALGVDGALPPAHHAFRLSQRRTYRKRHRRQAITLEPQPTDHSPTHTQTPSPWRTNAASSSTCKRLHEVQRPLFRARY